MSRNLEKPSPVQFVTAGPADENRRLDNYLMARLKGLPRTRIYQMLRRGEVRVNKGRVKQNYRLQQGDIIRIPPVSLEAPTERGKPPGYLLEMVKKATLHEDQDLLVLNKPSGLVVHGGSGRTFGVIELLRYLRPDAQDLQLVHRLDQDTSGCLLLCKSAPRLKMLQDEFREGRVIKKYLALLSGSMGKKKVDVSAPLKKNVLSSGERIVRVDESGKSAMSTFTRRRNFNSSCLAEVLIATGRTHQIRVHAKHIGHPVAGDEKYGDENFNAGLRKRGLKRLFLHASELTLMPGNNEELLIKAPLPVDLEDFLKKHE